jgi:hypothetical protein
MAQAPSGSGSSTPIVHPVYTTWKTTWEKLVHIYDGSGGFLDGKYLVAHPREWKDHEATTPRQPTKKLIARRKLARYENVAGTLLDQKRAALFRESITRTVGKSDKSDPHPIELWWKDVDGAGCSITDWMADAFTFAALFGHVGHYMDRASAETAKTAADQAQPFLRLYTPLDIPDWRLDDQGRLIAVRLMEAAPELDPTKPHISGQYRERLVTEDGWQLFDRTKFGLVTETTTGDEHTFGCVPFVIQYAKRRKLEQLIGQSVLGDPNLYIDLYNITSEIRELLRGQTFGITVVKLGTGDAATPIEKAQLMLGQQKGVENIMFTPDGAEYIQPDSTNVTVYQKERQELLRFAYRQAAVPWETDSQDAESEGSLKLKREDMNQVLAAYGDECEKAEIEIAKLWFRAEYGVDGWEKKFEEAEVVIRYPDNFDVTPFAEILEQTQAAVTLPMGARFTAEMCKRLVPRFIPDLPLDVQDAIEKEIDAEAKAAAEMERKTKEAELKALANPEPPGGFGA